VRRNSSQFEADTTGLARARETAAPSAPPAPRKGAVAVWGLACLMLVSFIAVMLGKLALTGTRAVLREQRQAQCEWLVQSGWSLARTRLTENPEYQGETWNIPADEFGGSDKGQVIIEIIPRDGTADNPNRQIRIRALYPKDSSQQTSITALRTWNARP